MIVSFKFQKYNLLYEKYYIYCYTKLILYFIFSYFLWIKKSAIAQLLFLNEFYTFIVSFPFPTRIDVWSE